MIGKIAFLLVCFGFALAATLLLGTLTPHAWDGPIASVRLVSYAMIGFFFVAAFVLRKAWK